MPCLQYRFRRCASFAFLSAFPRGKPPGPLALPTILPDLGTGRRIRSPPAGATQTPGTTSMPHACHIFPAKHPNRFSRESFRREDKITPSSGRNVPETGHNRATFRTESANPHQIGNGIPAGTDNAETRTHPGFWQLAPNQVLHPFCHPPWISGLRLGFWRQEPSRRDAPASGMAFPETPPPPPEFVRQNSGFVRNGRRFLRQISEREFPISKLLQAIHGKKSG